MEFPHKKIIFALVFSLSLISPKTPAYAANDLTYAISTTPVSIKVGKLAPGDSYDGTFKISNAGQKPANYALTLEPYLVENHSYNAINNIRNQFTEMTDWITINTPDGSFLPGESIMVNYHIDVPTDAHGGSQYASFVITSKNNSNGIIQPAFSLSVVIRADIDGEINYSGSIISQNIPRVLFKAPMGGTISVENTGNVAADVSTIMNIKNAFTGEEIYDNSQEPVEHPIIPESIRDYDVVWDGCPSLGFYTITLATSYLGQTESVSKTIFIAPIWFLVTVAIFLIVVILAIVLKGIRNRSTLNNRGFRFKN